MSADSAELETAFMLMNQTMALADYISVHVFLGVEMSSNRRFWCSNGKSLQLDFMSNELSFRENDLWLKPGKLIQENLFTKDECAPFFNGSELPMWKKADVVVDVNGGADGSTDGRKSPDKLAIKMEFDETSEDASETFGEASTSRVAVENGVELTENGVEPATLNRNNDDDDNDAHFNEDDDVDDPPPSPLFDKTPPQSPDVSNAATSAIDQEKNDDDDDDKDDPEFLPTKKAKLAKENAKKKSRLSAGADRQRQPGSGRKRSALAAKRQEDRRKAARRKAKEISSETRLRERMAAVKAKGCRPVLCKLCGETFPKRGDLSQHVDRYHLFKCVSCHVNFPTAEERKSHYETCAFCCCCQNDFSSISDLERHVVESAKGSGNAESSRTAEMEENTDTAGNAQSKNGGKNDETSVCVFRCRECGEVFDELSVWRTHESSLRCCKCDMCGKQHGRLRDLGNHLQWIHRLKVNCENCEEVFVKENDLISHAEHCKTCASCQKEFSTQEELKEHAFSGDNDCGFQCDRCDKIYLTLAKKTLHSLRMHNGPPLLRAPGPRSYKRGCMNCMKQFLSQAEHDQHIESCTTCQVCQREFPSQFKLRFHIRRYKCGYKCDQCPRAFLTELSLQRHKLLHEINSAIPLRVHPRVCRVCGQGFPDSMALKRHQRDECQYQCETCGQNFSDRHSMYVHRREEHPTNHICEICGAIFMEAHGLDQHRDRKSCTRNCPICGEKVVQMKTHMRIHEKGGAVSARALLECRVCGKKVQYYNMKRHMKLLHKAELNTVGEEEEEEEESSSKAKKKSQRESIPCKICGKVLQVFNMKRHMKIVHKIEVTARPRPELESQVSRAIEAQTDSAKRFLERPSLTEDRLQARAAELI